MTARADGVVVRDVPRDDLPAAAAALLGDGFRLALAAGHDDGATLRVVYAFVAPAGDRRTELTVAVPVTDARVPSLAAQDFTAGRFERALRDQFGIEPAGHPRPRRLVHHAHWPDD